MIPFCDEETEEVNAVNFIAGQKRTNSEYNHIHVAHINDHAPPKGEGESLWLFDVFDDLE